MRNTHKKVQPGIDTRDGTAYNLPLPDSSADAIICAQAFHWFGTPDALKEFGRVLKPGGSLGLIWNFYDRGNWSDYQRKIFVQPPTPFRTLATFTPHTVTELIGG
jgi:ubiquinone/menaquinone biosynthesis C-methylase UbiE